jgi:hypothetical protein
MYVKCNLTGQMWSIYPAFETSKATRVNPNEIELYKLGSEGWVLVISYLELETAYPNLGDYKYVTGLQPNIRPQRAILVFKRYMKK